MRGYWASARTDQLQGALVQDVTRKQFDVDDDHVCFLSPALVPARAHTNWGNSLNSFNAVLTLLKSILNVK